MKKETKPILTEVQKDALINFMSQRFGIYNIDFDYKNSYYNEPNGMTYQAIITAKVKELGIFNHSIETCELNAKIWNKDSKKDVTVTFGLSYKHKNGGSNGCDLDVRINILNNGSIFEIYRL